MTNVAQAVYARLDAMGLEYTRLAHAEVHTIADCAAIDAALGSLTAKNYFLCTKNRKRFFLCLVRPNARLRTADVSRQAGASRLSFAPEADLNALLNTHAGAVSPMGLMFDARGAVTLLVDGALRDAGRISFHPCDNTQTLSMRAADFFERFLPGVAHAPQWIEIHDFLNESEDAGHEADT